MRRGSDAAARQHVRRRYSPDHSQRGKRLLVGPGLYFAVLFRSHLTHVFLARTTVSRNNPRPWKTIPVKGSQVSTNPYQRWSSRISLAHPVYSSLWPSLSLKSLPFLSRLSPVNWVEFCRISSDKGIEPTGRVCHTDTRRCNERSEGIARRGTVTCDGRCRSVLCFW